MNSFARLAVAAIVVVAAGALGLATLGRQGPAPGPGTTMAPATPSPSPSLVATPPPISTYYSSSVNGISVSYPEGWAVREATEPWMSGPPSFHSVFGDVLYDPVLADHLFLGLFSQQLDEAGGDGWATSLLGGFGADCEQTETVTLGSTPGVLSPACLVAVASLDNRGYLVWLHVSGDDPAAAAPYDLDWFRAIVGTVRLNPRAAWMRLPLEETYTSDMHGISIAYPAGWRTSRSDEPWTDFLPAGYGDQMYMRETDSPFIAVASQPLAGKTSEEWIADLTSWDPSCDSATEPVEIDGEPGVITIQCGAERGQVNALVTAGERGYLITIYRNWDIGWFKEILETVDLRPEDATDAAS